MEIEEVRDRESLAAYLNTLEGDAGHKIKLTLAWRFVGRLIGFSIVELKHQNVGDDEYVTLLMFGALLERTIELNGGPSGSLTCNQVLDAETEDQSSNLASNLAFEALHTGDILSSIACSIEAEGRFLDKDFSKREWQRTQNDIRTIQKQSTDHASLWANTAEPRVFRLTWYSLREELLQKGWADWSFWVLWYERIREGREVHSAVLSRVLEKLTHADWHKGPSHINPMFDDVLEIYQAEDAARGDDLQPRKPANIAAIQSQVVALKDYVDGEIRFLTGINRELPADEEVANKAIQEVLEALQEIVAEMLACFEERSEPSRALMVVEEKLPAIVEKTGELADLETQPTISAPLVAMTATVKYLTDNGWPGHIAVGVAAGEYGLVHVKSGWKFVTSGKVKEPAAFTRFPPESDEN